MELEEKKIDLLLGGQIANFISEQYAYLSSAYKLIGHEEVILIQKYHFYLFLNSENVQKAFGWI